VSITLRGTETRHLETPALRRRVLAAVRGATRVFSVSDSLRRLLVDAGVDGARIEVVGNGVDLTKFRRLPRVQARQQLGLPLDAPVLVSVGGLVPRKGFQRVIDVLPRLVARHPGLRYLIVGGPSPEGDMSAALRAQVHRLGLDEHVVFTGPLVPDRLSVPLSAADVFVLATANEGWANVFLEAMACGLPVVTTDVGGNAEVVNSPRLGRLVRFGDSAALEAALADALQARWDHEAIVAYAADNTWDRRVEQLDAAFRGMQGAAAAEGHRP
jgi:teichuronic acid biosynthesis glycosyltransferase TuaC